MMQATTIYADAIKWRNEKRFLVVAAVCALLTAFTTIAIHQIHIPTGNFEETVQLYQNKSYLALNWIILAHCLMVLISMLGVALIIEKQWRALAILGFLLFALFVFSEWQRTLGNIWHLNGLRRKYAITTDVAALPFLRYEIQHRLSQSNVQFLLFTIGFTLGNASYGLALVTSDRGDRFLGVALLLWACCTSLAFLVDFFPARWMEIVVNACNKYYQPAIRFYVAYWLFQKMKSFKMARL